MSAPPESRLPLLRARGDRSGGSLPGARAPTRGGFPARLRGDRGSRDEPPDCESPRHARDAERTELRAAPLPPRGSARCTWQRCRGRRHRETLVGGIVTRSWQDLRVTPAELPSESIRILAGARCRSSPMVADGRPGISSIRAMLGRLEVISLSWV